HYGGGVIARHAAVTAGLPEVPGMALNRHCASGLTAVQLAAGSIRAGMDRLVVAGGVNSHSTPPQQSPAGPTQARTPPRTPPSPPDRPAAPNLDMSITVGWNPAVRVGISREDLDDWALRSHRNAVRALDEGRFKDETVPLDTPHGHFAA